MKIFIISNILPNLAMLGNILATVIYLAMFGIMLSFYQNIQQHQSHKKRTF